MSMNKLVLLLVALVACEGSSSKKSAESSASEEEEAAPDVPATLANWLVKDAFPKAEPRSFALDGSNVEYNRVAIQKTRLLPKSVKPEEIELCFAADDRRAAVLSLRMPKELKEYEGLEFGKVLNEDHPAPRVHERAGELQVFQLDRGPLKGHFVTVPLAAGSKSLSIATAAGMKSPSVGRACVSTGATGDATKTWLALNAVLFGGG
jgi:hypothetical protein